VVVCDKGGQAAVAGRGNIKARCTRRAVNSEQPLSQPASQPVSHGQRLGGPSSGVRAPKEVCPNDVLGRIGMKRSVSKALHCYRSAIATFWQQWKIGNRRGHGAHADRAPIGAI